jgi:succinate dehydrogenase/fumarate reductase flavoprotein subunit
VVKSFKGLEDLAVAYNIPLEALRETIDRYNGYVRNEIDEEFGKPILKGSKPLAHPPYYGVRLWPKVHYTMGGIQINTQAQVIDLSHQPIERLYAAGEVTGGIHGACRLGGLAITECLIFGRIAGRNAAQG